MRKNKFPLKNILKKSLSSKAFTMVELILVLAIIASLFTIGLLYNQTAIARNDLNTQTQLFVSYVRLTQSNAMAGKNGSSHGIHLESTQYTLFIGNSYNATDTQNFTIELPPTITLTNISLNGSGQDILFENSDGSTNTWGSIDLISSANNKTKTVTISNLGIINF